MTGSWLWPAFWCGSGLFVAWQAHAAGLGSFAEPGPGMVAFGLGIGMTLVGAGRAFAARGEAPDAPRPIPWRVAALSAVLAAYFALLEPAGYIVSTFALMLVLLRGFSELRWTHALALALGASFATYVVFRLGLGVQLPAGLLA